MNLQPCTLSFNMKAMIPVGYSGFFNCASMSVDGCYLYIIIHYGMSCGDCRKGWCLVVADPIQILKQETPIHTLKIVPKALMCPRCIKIVHMRDGSLSSSMLNEWSNSLVSITWPCDWNFRYICQFLQVGWGPVFVEMLLYPESWVEMLIVDIHSSL